MREGDLPKGKLFLIIRSSGRGRRSITQLLVESISAVPLEAPAIVNDKLHPGRLSEVARCVFWERWGEESGEGKRERDGEVSGGRYGSGVPSVGEQWELRAVGGKILALGIQGMETKGFDLR